MAFKSNLVDSLESGRRSPAANSDDAAARAEFGRKSPVEVMQQVWPDDNAALMPPTTYRDLQTNPSFDTRQLLAECESIARKHWWDKKNNTWGPDDYGQTPDGPSQTWPEEVEGYKYDRPNSTRVSD